MPFPFSRAAAPALVMLAALALAAPADAQYIGATPPPPSAPLAGAVETPAGKLARNVRLLAANPKNFDALMAAGRAELDLGDLEAAIGFFGRADEVRPSDPGPKIGMGAATIQTGDARGALAWFGQAQALGASAAVMGADRGLAHDLLGELAAAQSDYRAALNGPSRDEARRRLALSLAIGGQMREALAVLAPLSAKGDPAVPRLRAFIYALGGEKAQAASTIERAMPGTAARIGPFFDLLPRLSAEQKAAAVHLGVFPRADEVRLAAVQPPAPKRAAAPDPAARVPASTPRKGKEVIGKFYASPVKLAPPTAVAAREGSVLPAQPPKTATLPSERPSPPSAEPVKLADAEPLVVAARPEPEPPAAAVAGTSDRLSGIDRLLAQATEVPPAPQPKRDATSRKPVPDKAAVDKKAAAAKKAADAKKPAEAKKAAEEKKEQEAAAKLGAPGAHWVQLAGGSNQDRMATEYKRIKAKKPALFAGHPGHVTGGKDYFRLLVGPFDSSDEARAFVNKLAKAGIDGFSWTRTPAQIKIEKLPAK